MKGACKVCAGTFAGQIIHHCLECHTVNRPNYECPRCCEHNPIHLPPTSSFHPNVRLNEKHWLIVNEGFMGRVIPPMKKGYILRHGATPFKKYTGF